jgi:hypothetical protein
MSDQVWRKDLTARELYQARSEGKPSKAHSLALFIEIADFLHQEGKLNGPTAKTRVIHRRLGLGGNRELTVLADIELH